MRSIVAAVLLTVTFAAALLLSETLDAGAPTQQPAKLSPQQVERLVLLGRVWGFVKYHHPKVTGGDIAWDAALLSAMPRTLAAPTLNAARDTTDAWLSELGEAPACSPCAAAASDVYMQADLDWIRDERTLGKSLSGRLTRIYANRSTTLTQRFVRLAPAGNPEFTNESAYRESDLPPAHLRALAVIRFWNMLEYWSPYRDLIEHDRVALLREFLPQAWQANDAQTYQLVMMRLVARAHDSHANVWSSVGVRPPSGPFSLPVAVRWVEGRYVVSGYAHSRGANSGLKAGDILRRVGDASVDSMSTTVTPLYGSSNEAALHRDIARSLTRGRAGPVDVEIERNGKVLTISSARVASSEVNQSRLFEHSIPGDAFRMLNDSVAYLTLASVRQADVPEYLRRAAGASVFVIDIRNYPKEFVVFALGGHLTSGTPFARFTGSSPSNPGAFTFTQPIRIPIAEPRFAGKVVILVDESSQSQAEYTTMAFRTAPGAMVVGSTTSGADGNVSTVPLPGGLSAMITGIGVFYPDKRPTRRLESSPILKCGRPSRAFVTAAMKSSKPA